MEAIFMPVKNGYVTSYFGNRILNGKKQFHGGIDFGTKETDKTIFAPLSGIVRVKGLSYSFGNRIWVELPDKTYYVLAHMAMLFDTYKENDVITRGQKVGIMGNTGHSFGVHLHLEFRIDPSNPRTCIDSPYFKQF